MDKQENKVGEMGLSIFLILFSIFVIYVSYGISGSDITISSPGAFPLFISIMMLVFSLWIATENYRVSKNSNETISSKLKSISLCFNFIANRICYFYYIVLMVKH